MQYPRYLQPIIQSLLEEFRIVYLTGPRQSGKTTIARAIARNMNMRYITLDDQSVLATASFDPRGFVQSLGAENVVLDEFQNARGLIPAVKEVSDALLPGERGKFLLTGSTDIFSSARTQEALPGHMARLILFPLSVGEIFAQSSNIVDELLQGDFSWTKASSIGREFIARAVLDGGYPEVRSKSQRGKRIWFNSYMEGRFYKDFEALYDARNNYRSVLRALTQNLAGLCGNLLKYSSVADSIMSNDKTVKSYIENLELMYIVQRVPAFVKAPAKRLAVRMPKLHFMDTGLACHLLGIRTEAQLLDSRYYGNLVENLIHLEICKHAAWSEDPPGVYHFRDKRQREVDIVLERSDGKIVGVEIKASASVSNRDFDGLVALAELCADAFAHGVLFYTGEQVLSFTRGDLRLLALPIGLFFGCSNEPNQKLPRDRLSVAD